MFTPLFEPIPRTEGDTIRKQFEDYGHVNISGLVDLVLLEDAIRDIEDLSSPLNTSNVGNRETITQLRTLDPDKHEALHKILQGIQEGAVILGHDVVPPEGEGAYRLDLIEMEPKTRGPYQGRSVTFSGGAIAIANLGGPSNMSMKSVEGTKGADYFMRTGNVMFEDLEKNLRHRSYTGSKLQTVLTVTNLTPRVLENYPVTDTSRQNAT